MRDKVVPQPHRDDTRTRPTTKAASSVLTFRMQIGHSQLAAAAHKSQAQRERFLSALCPVRTDNLS